MKKNTEKKKLELSDSKVLEVLSESTRKTVVANKAQIEVLSKTSADIPNKYSRKSKKVLLSFVGGYDLLQYMIAVRPFICKRYNIKTLWELEVLLYLFPIQYFTNSDFKQVGLRQYNITLKSMLDDGYMKLCVKKVDSAGNLYALSDHSINIVKDFYKYLSGEKTINLKSDMNPFRGNDVANVDKIRERVMLKLKRQTETSPSKFRANLY